MPANPPSRRKKAAAASTSAAPPPKKPRTVAQSLNDANTALKKKYKAMTDKMEAAEEMFNFLQLSPLRLRKFGGGVRGEDSTSTLDSNI